MGSESQICCKNLLDPAGTSMPNLNCLYVRKVVEMVMSQVSILNASIERSNVYLSGFNLVFSFEQTKKISCSGVHNYWRMSDNYYIKTLTLDLVYEIIFLINNVFMWIWVGVSIAKCFPVKCQALPRGRYLKFKVHP